MINDNNYRSARRLAYNGLEASSLAIRVKVSFLHTSRPTVRHVIFCCAQRIARGGIVFGVWSSLYLSKRQISIRHLDT